MIKAQSKGTPLYEATKKMVEGGKTDVLKAELVRWGEQGGSRKQLILALTIEQIATDLYGGNAIPSLADTILVQQCHKIERYGDKTFPLSEKQIEVIVRDHCNFGM